jgi:hypothetical protein
MTYGELGETPKKKIVWYKKFLKWIEKAAKKVPPCCGGGGCK